MNAVEPIKNKGGRPPRKLTELEQLIVKATEAGFHAGCPKDQIENFIKAGIFLQPKQLEFVAKCRECDKPDGPTKIMFAGGRGAAKQVKTSETMHLWRRARSGNMLHMIKRADEVLNGDFLIGSDGKEKMVLGRSVPKVSQFYRVCFDDGCSLEVSDEHLWTVYDLSKRAPRSPDRGWFMATVETQWLASQSLKYRTQNRFAIPVLSAPVEPSNPTEPLLPPYTLGYWLGNGFRQGSTLHCHSDDVKEVSEYVADEIGKENVSLRDYKGNKAKSGTILIRGWIQRLKAAKWPYREITTASRKKRFDFIDDRMCIEWRGWSSKNRALLLAGLLDSDGTTKDAGCLEFDSKDIGLVQLVRQLLQSLGLKPYRIYTRPSKCENRSTMYRVTGSPDMQVFRLKRKQARLKTSGRRLREKRRYITSIEKIGFEEGICFEVDSPDHLYVAGNEYILTHNTHASLAQAMCDDGIRFPGLKILILRKIGKANQEQINDYRQKMLRLIPHQYKEQQGLFIFENGTNIRLGHFKDEKDIDKYMGQEYDLIVIAESNQITYSKKKFILTCLRTSKQGWRPRVYEDTNPGGIAHGDNKKIYYDPWKQKRETDTRYIHTTVYDNKFVNPEYVKQLESLTGWQRKAWLEGSWEFSAGAFFTNWNEDWHVFPNKHVTLIPNNPVKWLGSLDYGFSHPTAFHLHCTDKMGNTYTVGEYGQAQTVIEEHCQNIRYLLRAHHLEIEQLDAIPAGKDCFSKKQDGRTIAMDYEDNGITLVPVEIDRINAWATMLQRLGDPEKGIVPTWFIHRSCVNLIMQIPMAQNHETRIGDIAKMDADNETGEGGDDYLESARNSLVYEGGRGLTFCQPVAVGRYTLIGG